MGEISKQFASTRDATRHIVKACVALGIKNYSRVVKFAGRHLSIEMAEVHVQALLGKQHAIEELQHARRSRRNDKLHCLLAMQFQIPLDEAKAIVEDAKAGNEAARQKIREARSLRSLGQPAREERHLQNECADSCVNSTSFSESLLNGDGLSLRSP